MLKPFCDGCGRSLTDSELAEWLKAGVGAQEIFCPADAPRYAEWVPVRDKFMSDELSKLQRAVSNKRRDFFRKGNADQRVTG